MKIEISDIVISLNGRDEGRPFVVIGTEEEYSILADGKRRRVEKPKRKKHKHLRLAGKTRDRVAEKLVNSEKVTNSEIRRALAEHSAATGDRGGM